MHLYFIDVFVQSIFYECMSFADVHHVRAGLRVPHPRQCLSGAQAGYQAPQEGQEEGRAHPPAKCPSPLQNNA